MDRSLTSNERALLGWLLQDPEIPDVEALRTQAESARVVDGTPTLPTYLHLKVSGAPPAACPDGPLPNGAVVMSLTGEPTGFLDLWVKAGYLSAVEHSWVTDGMPGQLPSVQQLRAWLPSEVHQGET